MIYQTLREANIARQKEWDTDNQMSLSYSGNELAGEVGEAIEAALAAVDDESRASLSDELGDVVICVDLLAMRYDIPLIMPDQVSSGPWVGDALTGALLDMAMDAGRACNVVKKLDREVLGMKGSRSSPEALAGHLNDILCSASDVAAIRGLVLADCVAAKFNKTSEKVGLITRYDPNAPVMPKLSQVQLVTAFDWEGLYLDNKLVAEGHEVTLLDAITMAPGHIELMPSRQADDMWLTDLGGFPEKLSDVRYA